MVLCSFLLKQKREKEKKKMRGRERKEKDERERKKYQATRISWDIQFGSAIVGLFATLFLANLANVRHQDAPVVAGASQDGVVGWMPFEIHHRVLVRLQNVEL